eukprot:503272-Pyramimonas_sp.AAC.1
MRGRSQSRRFCNQWYHATAATNPVLLFILTSALPISVRMRAGLTRARTTLSPGSWRTRKCSSSGGARLRSTRARRS